MSIVLLRTLTGKSIIGFGQYRDLTIQNLIDTAQHKELLHMYYFLRNIDYNEDIIKQLKIDQVYRIDKKNSKDEVRFKKEYYKYINKCLYLIISEQIENNSKNNIVRMINVRRVKGDRKKNIEHRTNVLTSKGYLKYKNQSS